MVEGVEEPAGGATALEVGVGVGVGVDAGRDWSDGEGEK